MVDVDGVRWDMAKFTTHIPLGRVTPPDEARKLISELQELLNRVPGFGREYDPPVLAVALDSILTITAGETELPMLERLARTYLRL